MYYSTKKYHAFKRYLGNNIRIHREDNGSSQEELAKASSLKLINITNLEDGKGNSTLNILFRVACALEIEAYMLLEDIYGEDESGKRICLSHFSAYNDGLTKQEKQAIYDEMVASGKYTPPDER